MMSEKDILKSIDDNNSTNDQSSITESMDGEFFLSGILLNLQEYLRFSPESLET